MPEITNNEVLESERFLANTEQAKRDQQDEDALQDWAEYTMVTADTVRNPNLAVRLRDLANEVITNKRMLAQTPGAGPSQAMTPEQALAQQGVPGQMPPGVMPGAMPPGMPGGLPPGGVPPGVM